MIPARAGLWSRSVRFYSVGGMGIGVQLGVLALLKSGFGLPYLWATAMAVEAAVLHNFVWHVHWTWKDRRGTLGETVVRLAQFHLTNGLLSLVSNVVFMHLFVGRWRVPYLPANIAAIALTSVANFLVSEYFVFRQPRLTAQRH